jgi:hypothetical protein
MPNTNIQFGDQLKNGQVEAIYYKNVHLMLRYLNLQNRPFIIKFKKIHRTTDNIISIRMEPREDCWYKRPGIAVSAEEKVKFIMDVCKGLIDLSQLNITHFDLNRDNIVKVNH